MPTAPPSELDALRREIDRVDADLVRLLGQRLEVVAEIGRHKRVTEGLPLRPGREAVIMRRLIGLASPGFPKATLIRMWRELLAATTQAQAPYRVSVAVPHDEPVLWDIARDHFGSITPCERAASPASALARLADDRWRIAVLPLSEPWWTEFAPAPGDPRVVARLPFAPSNAYPDGQAALAVAALVQEPSGDDRSLLVLQTSDALDRAALRRLLAAFEPYWLAEHGHADDRYYLVELHGFLSGQDPALLAALASSGDRIRATLIGAYPRPLREAELA